MLNARASPGAEQVLRDAGIDGPLGAAARLLVDPGSRRLGVAGELLRTVRAAALSQNGGP